MAQERVFVSYHPVDGPLVDRLDVDLQKRGINALRDTRSVPRGHSKHWTIKEQILESSHFIVCLSPHYLEDQFSRTQLFIARAYGKRLLPILIGPFPDQSPRIALIKAGDRYAHAIKGVEELDIADFTGKHPAWGLGSYEKNFERLVDVIRPVPRPTPLNAALIYVSYNYKQEEFATRVARDLELARGVVWIDKLSIPIGSNWRGAMYEGLRSARHFVICLNPDAARSENVNHEVLVAKLRGLPIYPVLSEEVHRDPHMMAELEEALRESTEMKSINDLRPFAPDPSYDAMLEELKRAVGVADAGAERKDGIFISYRRADSQAVTGRIHEKLVEKFGAENVFADVDTIPAGVDFSDYYKKWLASKAAVVLVIMGKTWASIRDEEDPSGPPRVQKNGDHVRIEVVTALSMNDVRVVPVLVDDAKMPPAHNLPEDLQQLSNINSLVVRHDPDFGRDVGKLIEVIRTLPL